MINIKHIKSFFIIWFVQSGFFTLFGFPFQMKFIKSLFNSNMKCSGGLGNDMMVYMILDKTKDLITVILPKCVSDLMDQCPIILHISSNLLT